MYKILCLTAVIFVLKNGEVESGLISPYLKGEIGENKIVILEGNCSTVESTDIVVKEKTELPAIPFFKRSHEIKYRGDQTIVCITVFQLKDNEHPGEVTITDGGFGHKYIDIEMKSDRGHGLHLETYVYAQWR